MCLFCNDDIFGCKYCNPNAAPPWFTAGVTAPKQHIHNVKMGLHPTGAPLLSDNDGSKKCGNCIHAVAYRQSGTWYKCDLRNIHMAQVRTSS